jgi:hypothetical protein
MQTSSVSWVVQIVPPIGAGVLEQGRPFFDVQAIHARHG